MLVDRLDYCAEMELEYFKLYGLDYFLNWVFKILVPFHLFSESSFFFSFFDRKTEIPIESA